MNAHKSKAKAASLARRQRRVRGKIHGNAVCPRLRVTRSGSHIYAQIIDDDAGKTLASASSLTAEFKKGDKSGATVEGAELVGKLVGKAASRAHITKVVFDRGGYLYHGRVKALAEGARESGLQF
ncbi:MAG: 50S ribosomal protein L18 [Coriobacteriales bacterium]|jgi:large subunit ribosomal protein L18|nr:50S ribosomal protein L18 [Coriobacteriales bacterium]